MAIKLITAFASILSITVVWALSLAVQWRVTKVDRKKGGREWGDYLKKVGSSILIAGAVGGLLLRH